MFNRLQKLFALVVWDNQGRQYAPVWGYDGEISHYDRAEGAIETFNRTWLEESGMETARQEYVREREQFRTDFDDTFLRDHVDQIGEHGHDPRNHIGRRCGVNAPRILQIWHDRSLVGGIPAPVRNLLERNRQ